MESIIEKNKRLGIEQKRAMFRVKQGLDFDFKIKYAELRAKEFVEWCDRDGLNYHVSVGGLDSITLFLFPRSIGINAPGISASFLEHPGNQKVHRALGIIPLSPIKDKDGNPYTKARVIQEFGFPVLSKEIAAKIELLQNPSEKNKTVRHAIITGETGEYGGFQKNSRMRLAQKWLEKFGGYENETENVNYQKPNFKVSSRCCYYLKERPCEMWAKEHNSVPFLGLMASEGGRREKALTANGCNYWSENTKRSCPFAIFTRDDILRLAILMDEWYHEHHDQFPGEEIDTIIPSAYGKIVCENGHYRTTGAQRTGCSMCGFGIHLEKRPNRFDILYKENPKEWEYLMFNMCTDENGEKYGWARVLDYIGVEWRQIEQTTLF